MLISMMLVVLSLSGTAQAIVIYVDADADGANNGLSWEDAYNYLQDAIYAIGTVGGEIRVARGVYRPDEGDNVTSGDPWAAFLLIEGLVIKGGYAGDGEADPDERDIKNYETILSGDLAGNDVEINNPRNLIDEPARAENSQRVVRGSGFLPSGDQRPVLDGFTISGGNAQYSGGGISLDMSDVMIMDCTFKNNSAGYRGGALYLFSCSPVIIRCSFICNAAEKRGGGACLDGCDTCRESFPDFEACKFINNWAADNGGGVDSVGYTQARFTNSAFIGNITDGIAGGIYDHSSYGILLDNCTVADNSDVDQGGIFSQGSYYTGGPTVRNCIVWGNKMLGSGIVVTYSDIEGGWPGTANINADPCFVQTGYWDTKGTPADPNDDLWIDGDYHLLADSPCINAGDPVYPPGPTDLDGAPRVVNGQVDMGAYEYQITLLAEARMVPHNINPASRGKWITCYIWLPEGYDVWDIEPGSIRLEGEIRPPWMWFDENKQVAMVKFRRSDVQQILEAGDMELIVSGELIDGTEFEATVTVRVVGKK